MNTMKKFSEFIHVAKGIVLGLVLVVAGAYIYAWTGPTNTPPQDNVPAPLNVSSITQVKAGALGIGGVTPSTANNIFLDVNGKIKIRGGSPGTDKILRSNDSGTGDWVNPAPAVTFYTIIARSRDNDSNQSVSGGSHDVCFLGGMSHWDNNNSGPEKCKVERASGGTWRVDTYTQDDGSQTLDGENLGSLV